MIISHKYKFIFIHIPKTGGISITNSMINIFGKRDIYKGPKLDDYKAQEIERRIKSQELNIGAHTSISNINRQTNNLKGYFKFSFVRNPWDRMVSLYFYLRNTSLYGKLLPNAPSFNDWILSDLEKITTYMPISVPLRHKKRPQLEWIRDQNGNITVDFIGRFENLQNDFDIFLDKCNIPHVQLLHENKTTHDHYTKYYTKESIKKVSEWYKEDISYFHYKFGE